MQYSEKRSRIGKFSKFYEMSDFKFLRNKYSVKFAKLVKCSPINKVI